MNIWYSAKLHGAPELVSHRTMGMRFVNVMKVCLGKKHVYLSLPVEIGSYCRFHGIACGEICMS